MVKSDSFINFLKSFRNGTNDSLIESVIYGYVLIEGSEGASLGKVQRMNSLVDGLISDIIEVTDGDAANNPLMDEYNDSKIDLCALWSGLAAYYRYGENFKYGQKIAQLVMVFISRLDALVDELPEESRAFAKRVKETVSGKEAGSWGRYLNAIAMLFIDADKG